MGKKQQDADSGATVDDAESAALAGEQVEVIDIPDDVRLMLEDARNKADEHWNQLLRSKAEIENLQRRHARELENAHKFALERFAAEMLAVRDSMELGVEAANSETADVDSLREGTALTLKLLSDVMERFQIVQIDPIGEPFDPEYHQAVSTQPRDDVPPNTVTAVMQKGYTLNERLIRPAMVMVSQGPPVKIDEQA
ncbi:MAG: nucleotide exchange factor GrpE [Gammaproteobacteria bacterium]|jgi:molecular chaperone GrpE